MSPVGSYKPSPPPAKERQAPDTPRRRMKKSLSQPLHSEYAELYRLGSDGRRLVLREAVDAMPDPTPFLQGSADAQVPRERPAVIPPIACERRPGGSASGSPRRSPARDRQHRTHVGVAHRIHHAPPPAPPPELETLAVDQVGADKVVRKRSGADRTV